MIYTSGRALEFSLELILETSAWVKKVEWESSSSFLLKTQTDHCFISQYVKLQANKTKEYTVQKAHSLFSFFSVFGLSQSFAVKYFVRMMLYESYSVICLFIQQNDNDYEDL